MTFMKRSLSIFAAIFLLAAVAAAQRTTFPGLTPAAKKELDAAKRSLAFPLPTWLPAGFEIAAVESNLGRKVKIEDKVFSVTYRRTLKDDKEQSFSITAGFDGIGDLMYDGARTLRTGVGRVYLLYQPLDEDGKKMPNFAMTEWFSVGKTAFHYNGNVDSEDESLVMISLADTEKILRSLKRY